MQQPSDNLVFDRTKAQAERVSELNGKMSKGTATDAEIAEWMQTSDGALNFVMLNRLEQWTTYLAAQLRSYGYQVPVQTRTWTRTDRPTRSEVDRIRRNVDALQAGFYSLPDWREIVYDNTMHYTQANALEWDLQRLYDWLRAMVSNFQMRQANTIFMQAGGILNA